MKRCLKLFICLVASLGIRAQATVGLIKANTAEDGYELFAPIRADTTYLIDKCGRRIHQWASPNTPGLSVYLLPDGSLLRTANIINPAFRVNGALGGEIEKYDWDNNLTWSYTISTTTETQNHDVYPMANGNILVVIWEIIDSSVAIANGRNPVGLQPALYSAKIEELQPVGTNQANIVWQWRLWDHLVQDFDSTKPNYGVLANHPELVNLNFVYGNAPAPDWVHPNAITYNSDLDQVMLSARNMSEVWIIDHSTTTAEATTHAGGTHGKGGDLLYRWGNPQVYNRGTTGNEVFYIQHSATWIPDGFPKAGSIMVFNNGVARPGGNASSVDIFTPPVDSNGNYPLAVGQAYGPSSLTWTYEGTPASSFYSNVMGSGQMLANGNVVICAATTGNFFEVDSGKNVLWRYINPVSADTILSQGSIPVNNQSFRVTQYDAAFLAPTGDSLLAKGHIEKNALLTACDSSDIGTGIEQNGKQVYLSIYPNPATDKMTVALGDGNAQVKYQLFDIKGQLITIGDEKGGRFDISVSNIEPGIYLIKLESEGQVFVKKMVIN